MFWFVKACWALFITTMVFRRFVVLVMIFNGLNKFRPTNRQTNPGAFSTGLSTKVFHLNPPAETEWSQPQSITVTGSEVPHM